MTLKIDAHGFWQTGFFGKMVRLTTVQGNRRSFADLMRINRVFTRMDCSNAFRVATSQKLPLQFRRNFAERANTLPIFCDPNLCASPSMFWLSCHCSTGFYRLPTFEIVAVNKFKERSFSFDTDLQLDVFAMSFRGVK
jgi:hypothetical protein